MKKAITSFVAGVFLAATASLGLGAIQTSAVGAATSVQSAASYATPGAFCAASLRGQKQQSVGGVTLTCTTSNTDSRLRWREVVK
jgi:hypothetical protein